MQHLELPHGAVAGVDLQSAVIQADRALVVAGIEVELAGPPFRQLQHVFLDGPQQGDLALIVAILDVDEGLDLRYLQLHQLVQVVAPQLAHGGEQRIGGALQGLEIRTGLELVFEARQCLAIEQVPQ